MLVNKFQYEILAEDLEAGSAVVKYTASGYPDVVITIALPFEGEDPVKFIKNHAPHMEWERYGRRHMSLKPGSRGTIELEPTPV